MPEKLRKALEKRGLKATASEQEAWVFYQGLDEAVRTEVATEVVGKEKPEGQKTVLEQMEDIRQEAIRADAVSLERERARIREIQALGRKHGIPSEMLEGWINRSVPLAQVNTEALEWIARHGRTEGDELGTRHDVQLTADERDKTRSAAVDGLSFRAGFVEKDERKRHDPQGNPFVVMTLLDLAKARLRAFGQTVPMQPNEIFRRAMTDSDLPYITAATANKFLYRGWEEQPTTYQIWCDEGQLPNYKAATFPRPSAFPDLLEVNAANGEYKYGAYGDQVETATLKHWGRMLGVSLQTMVDDDLSTLSETPSRMGAAARRTIDKYVYQTVLTSNSGTGETMGDATVLFTSGHANYVASGSGAAISITTLDTLAQMMENQTDGDGTSYVGEAPKFVLCNSYYRFLLTNILVQTNPNQLGDASTPVFNPWQGLTPVFSPHITTNSKKWWALAGPRGKTVRVFGLGGPPRPVVEDRAEFANAGYTFRVTMDYIAKALDWRYLAANYGS